jgi:pantoate--beta-alanine ligase
LTIVHACRPEGPHLATVRTVAALRAAVAAWRRAGATIGLVPTMGALHAGHMALVARARAECERVVATLFVNPTQFDDKTDLKTYPADEAADAALLAEAGVDLIFAPAVEEMYPQGFTTNVTVAGLTDCLCGLTRPGHFDGVATVVAKLFNQAQADTAYFGEKDYQQLLLVRHMAQDLDIPVRVIAVPTVRESDGLALSSRNLCLTPAQRRIAPELYRILTGLAERLPAMTAAGPELAHGHEALSRAGFDRIDYLELRHQKTLAPLVRAGPGARLFAAAWLDRIRLIDNLAVA